MPLYEISEKFTLAQERGFMFIHINKLTIKIYSHQRYLNISYYLEFRMPMCHRKFFRKFSQNRDYVDIFCIDRNNPFHFACQKWISELN